MTNILGRSAEKVYLILSYIGNALINIPQNTLLLANVLLECSYTMAVKATSLQLVIRESTSRGIVKPNWNTFQSIN